MNYGDALDWCVKHDTAFRFIRRDSRPDFAFMNESVPGDKALELALTINGRHYIAHAPLDSSKDPSNAIAAALIGCVEFFVKNNPLVATAKLN